MESIEEEIRKTYKTLEIELKEKMAPIERQLMEAKVDPGVIANMNDEVLSNAQKGFFNKVLNSSIKLEDLGEIKDSVKKDAFKFLESVDGKDREGQYAVSKEVADIIKDYDIELKTDNKAGDILNLSNGERLIIVEPENGIYRFENEESKQEELKIEEVKAKIRDLFKLAKEHPERIGEHLKNFFQMLLDTEGGLGIDATLRQLDEEFKKSGSISNFLENDFNRMALEKTIEVLDSGEATEKGFTRDNYTLLREMSIISQVLNDKSVDPNSPQIIELKQKLKKVAPEAYALIEKNPNLLEQLEQKYNVTDPQDIAIEIAGSSKSISVEETVSLLNEQVKEFSQNETEMPKNDSYKKEPEEVSTEVPEEKSIKVSEEQKAQNLTKTLNGMLKVKGLEFVQSKIATDISRLEPAQKKIYVKGALDSLRQNSDMADFYTKKNSQSRKEIFMEIINSGILTEESSRQMGEIDENLSKEILQELIDKQNDGTISVDRMKPIMLLGDGLSKSKSENVLDASKTKIGNVIVDERALINQKINDRKTLEGEDQER